MREIIDQYTENSSPEHAASPLSTVVAMDISERLSSSAVPARFNDVAAEQWHIKGGLLLKQAANAPN